MQRDDVKVGQKWRLGGDVFYLNRRDHEKGCWICSDGQFRTTTRLLADGEYIGQSVNQPGVPVNPEARPFGLFNRTGERPVVSYNRSNQTTRTNMNQMNPALLLLLAGGNAGGIDPTTLLLLSGGAGGGGMDQLLPLLLISKGAGATDDPLLKLLLVCGGDTSAFGDIREMLTLQIVGGIFNDNERQSWHEGNQQAAIRSAVSRLIAQRGVFGAKPTTPAV